MIAIESNWVGLVELSEIRQDSGLQMRESLSDEYVQKWAGEMESGVEFPPVILFYDGTEYWLADGFHRVASASRAKLDSILAAVRLGDWTQALRYALQANDNHGNNRNSRDLDRCYKVAVEAGLCDPCSSSEVTKLLGCTKRHAQRLTTAAREAREQMLGPQVDTRLESGMSDQQIADELGLSRYQVRRRRVCAKRTMSDSHKPDVTASLLAADDSQVTSSDETASQPPPVDPFEAISQILDSLGDYEREHVLQSIQVKYGINIAPPEAEVDELFGDPLRKSLRDTDKIDAARTLLDVCDPVERKSVVALVKSIGLRANNSVYSEEFLRFWESYPKQRRTAKASAYKAWDKALKGLQGLDAPDGFTWEEYLISRAAEYAASEVGRGQYVKGPESWLNGGCWDDDPAAWKDRESSRREHDRTNGAYVPGKKGGRFKIDNVFRG